MHKKSSKKVWQRVYKKIPEYLDDITWNLLLQTDHHDLLNYCFIDKQSYRVCSSTSFWIAKFNQDGLPLYNHDSKTIQQWIKLYDITLSVVELINQQDNYGLNDIFQLYDETSELPIPGIDQSKTKKLNPFAYLDIIFKNNNEYDINIYWGSPYYYKVILTKNQTVTMLIQILLRFNMNVDEAIAKNILQKGGHFRIEEEDEDYSFDEYYRLIVGLK